MDQETEKPKRGRTPLPPEKKIDHIRVYVQAEKIKELGGHITARKIAERALERAYKLKIAKKSKKKI